MRSLILLLILATQDSNRSIFTSTAKVKDMQTVNRSIMFFQLDLPGPEGGSIVISGDDSLPIIKFLQTHSNERIHLELTGR